MLVGEGSTVSAASIGNNVVIGKGATLGEGCILLDNVLIDDGASVKAFDLVPPYCRVTVSGHKVPLNDSYTDRIKKQIEWQYDEFIFDQTG